MESLSSGLRTNQTLELERKKWSGGRLDWGGPPLSSSRQSCLKLGSEAHGAPFLLLPVTARGGPVPLAPANHYSTFSMILTTFKYFIRASLVAQLVKNLPTMQETPV